MNDCESCFHIIPSGLVPLSRRLTGGLQLKCHAQMPTICSKGGIRVMFVCLFVGLFEITSFTLLIREIRKVAIRLQCPYFFQMHLTAPGTTRRVGKENIEDLCLFSLTPCSRCPCPFSPFSLQVPSFTGKLHFRRRRTQPSNISRTWPK